MGKRLTTTKSGCQTCKARKVKCDQERPSCKRCTSKGRKCGGYGIWSDASTIKPHAERIACKTVALSPNLATTILSDCSPSENMAFDWFVTKALSKLPGPFVLKYWNTVLVQACLQDSSVLHAVLALSETHRGKSERNVAQDDSALKHYTTAVRRLQARLQTPNECNSTVTMISCLAFVNLELLRSNFVSALTHLRSGLRILEESSFVARRFRRLALAPRATPVEEAIFRAFARINVLVALQDRQSHECHIVTQREKDEPIEFTDLPSAWLNLEEILNQTSSLLHEQQAVDCHVIEFESSRLRWRLASWWMSFDALVPVPDSDLCHVVLYHLLHNWGTMTAVMIESTQFEDEADFDQFHSSFETIIHHATISRELRLPSTPLPTKTKQSFNMSHSLVDVGWIPPLYYIAVKCRNYKLRMRAIELIESANHREGIWDSIISASIARAVVEIEHHERKETSTLADSSQSFDRIVDLRVVLPDSPCRSVFLHYRLNSNSWMTRTLDCVS